MVFSSYTAHLHISRPTAIFDFTGSEYDIARSCEGRSCLAALMHNDDVGMLFYMWDILYGVSFCAVASLVQIYAYIPWFCKIFSSVTKGRKINCKDVIAVDKLLVELC